MAKRRSVIRELKRNQGLAKVKKRIRAVYLNRIVLEFSGLSHDVRGKLSLEAGAWYRAAVEAINQGSSASDPRSPRNHRPRREQTGQIVGSIGRERFRALRGSNRVGNFYILRLVVTSIFFR
jgi:hypothetical protein